MNRFNLHKLLTKSTPLRQDNIFLFSNGFIKLNSDSVNREKTLIL